MAMAMENTHPLVDHQQDPNDILGRLNQIHNSTLYKHP